MREIWLFWRSYATGSNTAHAVWSCGGLLFISFHILIHNCVLNARGSVTDGKSSLPVCRIKNMSEDLMSDEIKGLSSGSYTWWPRRCCPCSCKIDPESWSSERLEWNLKAYSINLVLIFHKIGGTFKRQINECVKSSKNTGYYISHNTTNIIFLLNPPFLVDDHVFKLLIFTLFFIKTLMTSLGLQKGYFFYSRHFKTLYNCLHSSTL